MMPASGSIRNHGATSPAGIPHTAIAIDAAIRRVRRSSAAAAVEGPVEHRTGSKRAGTRLWNPLPILLAIVPQRFKSAGSRLVKHSGDFIGGAGSYERGFVSAAVVLVVLLGTARLILGSTPVVGAVVPMLLLACILAYRLRHTRFGATPGADGEAVDAQFSGRIGRFIDTRWKAAILGIVCAPALMHFVRTMSPAKSQRAFIWTCWLAFLVGSFGVALSAAGATVQ